MHRGVPLRCFCVGWIL